MKNRLYYKKAGFAIVSALIIISLAEIIFRATVIGEAVFATPNLGKQLAVIVFAVAILILNAKGKDRVRYLCYASWVIYFVFDQFFNLPSYITNFVNLFAESVTLPSPTIAIVTNASLVLSTIFIIAIGILLLEYMNDGTIYSRAFNILCIVTIVMILGNIGLSVYGAIEKGLIEALLATFHDLYRIAMVFMTAFFAYDSAKYQLQKTKLSK